MSHVPVARHDPAEGHEVVFPAVRDMWVSLFCSLYQVRFPGLYWKTCSCPGKDCVTMEMLICYCNKL